MTKNEDDLKKLFEDFNREQMSERFNADERAQIRLFFRKDGPAEQLNTVLEERRRNKWLLKLLGMFLLAAPAVAAVSQGFSKIIEWIRGQ